MAKVYGIDLGTTYSTISTLDDNGMPLIIENHVDSGPLLASAVYFPVGSEPVVGKDAKEKAIVEPDRVVQFVKRQIGKPDAQVWEFEGKQYDPIYISSLILKRMKEYAAEQGHEVKDVIITCPAYFGMDERAATKQAGIIAGLNVLSIINEPTAAALNYCSREYKENRKIMVYDLGGGTFDVTLLDYNIDDNKKTSIDVIDSGGDDRLGGIDWDSQLDDHLCELYSNENGISKDEMETELRQKILSQVEDVKKVISNIPNRSVTISHAGDSTRLEVTRIKFEELTKHLVDRTMTFVHELLEKNNLSAEKIDIVLLVGGSTRMPMIKSAIEGLFQGKVRVEDPDLAVAKGAALAAAIEWNKQIEEFIDGQSDKIIQNDEGKPITKEEASGLKIKNVETINTFSDMLSRSFGPAVFVDNQKYMIDNLLFVGDKSPSEARETYYTMADNQPVVDICVFENVAEDRTNKHVTPSLDENQVEQYTDPALKVKNIGKVTLSLQPNTPKDTPIEVVFKCSSIGLEVSATNLQTKETVSSVIISENTKTLEELDEAVKRFASVRTKGQI